MCRTGTVVLEIICGINIKILLLLSELTYLKSLIKWAYVYTYGDTTYKREITLLEGGKKADQNEFNFLFG